MEQSGGLFLPPVQKLGSKPALPGDAPAGRRNRNLPKTQDPPPKHGGGLLLEFISAIQKTHQGSVGLIITKEACELLFYRQRFQA